MASWPNSKLTKRQVDQTSNWPNGKLTKCHVDVMASWPNSKLTKWQVDQTASWLNGPAPNDSKKTYKVRFQNNKSDSNKLIHIDRSILGEWSTLKTLLRGQFCICTDFGVTLAPEKCRSQISMHFQWPRSAHRVPNRTCAAKSDV